ncbi:probable DNA double-strand break repair Rad50 ATPase [Montipora capricornis]|uniref:probable DNA double-strand break repair Rad50 ATPase n=1 Tax=Montipora capricornis TaxID=246305 RepID=UPI0035F133AC
MTKSKVDRGTKILHNLETLEKGDVKLTQLNIKGKVQNVLVAKPCSPGFQESVGSAGSSVMNKETWENLQHELVKTSESKLHKNIEGLKKELKDEKKTTSKLRDELKQTLAENQLLKTKCARNNEQQQMSLNEETERLRSEIEILKRTRVEQYIKADSEVKEGVSLLMEQTTFTDRAANINDVEDNYQLPEPDEESNLTAANKEDKSSLMQTRKISADSSGDTSTKQQAGAKVNSDEEWIAVCYGSNLKYFAHVLKETTEVLTVKFLERKADGCYEIKKAEEEVEKILVFERNVPVTWEEPGRYIVQDLKNITKKHKEHWKMMHMKEKLLNLKEKNEKKRVVHRCGHKVLRPFTSFNQDALTMDFFWDRCIICQRISETPLKCSLNANTTDIDGREVYKNFLENANEFQSQSFLPVELKLDLSTATVELLIANRASWHKSCRLRFTTSKLEKAKERQSAKRKRETEEEESRTRRNSQRRQASKNNEVCIFYKKDSDEILHDFTSLAVDKKIRDMAKELEDFELLSSISGGDLVAIEAQYHIGCLTKFRNSHRSLKRKEDNMDEDSLNEMMNESQAFVELECRGRENVT